MSKIVNSLTGKFLVSTTKMPDPRFARQVVLICSHSAEDGAMGVVVNAPYGQISFADVLGSFSPSPAHFGEKVIDVYIGGPIEPEAGFVLFESTDYSVVGELRITDSLAVSREKLILQDLAAGRGPQHYLLVLGYAGWGAGQLEMELSRNGWLVVPADNDVIFRMADGDKWQMAAGSCGIDITLFDDNAAYA